MESPFQFGTLATDQNFIDRVEDRAQLKQMLSLGINVTLISPRRWGKSSLVKKAMDELTAERKDIRVCYLDGFSINSEEEFYSQFAAKVIACASGKVEKADFLFINLQYKPQDMDKMQILDLPEKIAQDKGIRIIVCIDEFQQLAHLPAYSAMEGKMRSVWQQQKNVSYCLYGSKKHMMLDIFGNTQKPFYRFSNIVFMPKIRKEDWIPFIINGFSSSGKSITQGQAETVCDITECHSWYLQQLCYFIWSATDGEVNEAILNASIQRLVDTNAPMFMSDTEKLTPSQREMLRAIVNGEQQLTAEKTRSRYHLGNPNTIIRNKKVLMEKSFIEMDDNGVLTISDPVFLLWYKWLSA